MNPNQPPKARIIIRTINITKKRTMMQMTSTRKTNMMKIYSILKTTDTTSKIRDQRLRLHNTKRCMTMTMRPQAPKRMVNLSTKILWLDLSQELKIDVQSEHFLHHFLTRTHSLNLCLGLKPEQVSEATRTKVTRSLDLFLDLKLERSS